MLHRHKRFFGLCLSLKIKLPVLLFPVTSFLFAQIPLEQKIDVRFNDDFRSVAVFRMEISYDTLKPGDTLYFYNWLNAYSDIHSGIGEAISGQYKLHFAFSSENERGFLKVDSASEYQILHPFPDWFKIILKKHFPEGKHQIMITGRLKLPDAKFTGIGYRKHGAMLRDWLPMPVFFKEFKPYRNKNLNDLPLVDLSVRLTLNVKCSGCHPSAGQERLLSDGRMQVFLKSENNRLDMAFYGEKPLRIIRKGTLFIIDRNFFSETEDAAKIIALDRVTGFLEQFSFSFPDKVLIDNELSGRHPVYGIHWLPVMNPFDKNFVLEINLLKQIIKESMRYWHVDLRRDYAFWAGLMQWLVMEYVSRFYPEIRLAGKTGHWPFLNIYEFFRYPYIYKYPLSYYYMVSMNRDQDLLLSADSLTNFNREIAVPYKSALAWRNLRYFSVKEKFDPWLKNILILAGKNSLQPGQILDSAGFDFAALRFFKGNYYQSAMKPDFKLKGKKKGDSLELRILNRGNIALPVVLSGMAGDSICRKKILFFRGKDTSVYMPYNQRITWYVNKDLLYPEPEKGDNIWPRSRKKISIRPVSDLRNPFKRQFFFNPSVDFNLYDGLITGMAVNNKTLLDRTFAWEFKPDYAWRSQTLTGSGNFKWIKHYVSPHFFGFSLGGYFDIYHYDFDRFYRIFDVYFTLNFKNRKKKLMQGNTIAIEWLYVHKDAPVQDESTRYAVFRLSDLQFKKAFLNRYSLLNILELHRSFVKWQTEFKFRRFIDQFRQFEFRFYFGWMPVNHTGTDYFSFALSRPVDYLFKYHYYGRSEEQGIMAQQYIYAEGAFKVFYPDQFANQVMAVNNLNIGIWKRFNLYVDYGWVKKRHKPWRFHYDAGLRYYLVPDFFELYFPVISDSGMERFDKTYWQHIRIMFVFSLPDLFKMFSRSWY